MDSCFFHFPAVRCIEEEPVSSYGQVLKVREEIREFHAAAPGSLHKCVEAWDVIAALENWLRIQAREGLDVVEARELAYRKNRERGYYLEGDPIDGLIESARVMLLKVCAQRDSYRARLVALGEVL